MECIILSVKEAYMDAQEVMHMTDYSKITALAELFFNHSSTETFRDKLLKLVLADSSRLSASDGQEPEKTEILR